jgi:hypothetical protein
MDTVKKFILPLLFLVSSAILYLLIGRLTENTMDSLLSGSEPFGVRLALIEDEGGGPVALAQMVIQPAEMQVLYYFINTDAAYEDSEFRTIRELGLSGSDRMAAFTDVPNRFHVQITQSHFRRLIDLMEGLPIFNDTPLEIEESKYQFPLGFQALHGESLLDFISLNTKPETGKEYLASVDRMLRAESELLNLFWNRREIVEALRKGGLNDLAFSLIDTNMNGDEFESLVDYLIQKQNVNGVTLEVPMFMAEKPGPNPFLPKTKVLIVKEKRARAVYREYLDNMRSGKFYSDSFSVEILNGTEIKGLARKLKSYIQDRGPLVLDVNNYPYRPLARSVILIRSGNLFVAEKIIEIAGLERERLFFNRKNLEVDASYLVGDDIDTKKLHL